MIGHHVYDTMDAKVFQLVVCYFQMGCDLFIIHVNATLFVNIIRLEVVLMGFLDSSIGGLLISLLISYVPTEKSLTRFNVLYALHVLLGLVWLSFLALFGYLTFGMGNLLFLPHNFRVDLMLIMLLFAVLTVFIAYRTIRFLLALVRITRHLLR